MPATGMVGITESVAVPGLSSARKPKTDPNLFQKFKSWLRISDNSANALPGCLLFPSLSLWAIWEEILVSWRRLWDIISGESAPARLSCCPFPPPPERSYVFQDKTNRIFGSVSDLVP